MSQHDRIQAILDDYLDQSLQGKAPDLEVFLATYSDLSEAEKRKFRRLAGLAGGHETLAGEPDAGDGTDGLREGDVLGDFEIIRKLGQGGMGVVYLATQKSLARPVAVKVLRPGLASSEQADRRLEREALAAANLQHPNIVSVLATGEQDGTRYIVMEYVPGVGLDQVLKERSGTVSGEYLKKYLGWAHDIALALDRAHQAGIIHRDVKPSNIRINEDERAVLLDFGLAKAQDSHHTLSRTGSFRGTPHYASPEQVAPSKIEIDARTDVYSLGATFYECVVGVVPFEGDTSQQVFSQILHREPVPPRRLVPSLSRDLETVILTAMEKDRGRRYQTARAFADDLQALLDMRPIQARPPGVLRRAERWARRHPLRFVALFLAVLTLLGGPLVYAFFERRLRIEVQAEKAIANNLRSQAEDDLREIERLSDVKLVRDLKSEANALWPPFPDMAPAYQDWLRRADQILQRTSSHEDMLNRLRSRGSEVSKDSRPSTPESWPWFLQPEEIDELEFENASEAWQFKVLQDLSQELKALRTVYTDVQARLETASQVEQRTLTSAEAQDAWEDAISDIQFHELYAGLELSPQVGLLPLEPDLDSGLWEFWHLQSGERPQRDPDTEQWRIQPETGMVLVLIPGGTFTMGARRPSSRFPLGSANVDPRCDSDENPLLEVTLDAFFLSKYEMTQAQWIRVAGFNPSNYKDGALGVGEHHPVERVSWQDGARMLHRYGLDYPTEAQWEYAARAGTTTPYFTGEEEISLQDYANVGDLTIARGSGPQVYEYNREINDGHICHAPVGSFLANDFGLHDMLGNVWEWCRDHFSHYHAIPPRPGDGLRRRPGHRTFVNRGGCFLLPPLNSRVTERNEDLYSASYKELGLRAAAEIRKP